MYNALMQNWSNLGEMLDLWWWNSNCHTAVNLDSMFWWWALMVSWVDGMSAKPQR